MASGFGGLGGLGGMSFPMREGPANSSVVKTDEQLKADYDAFMAPHLRNAAMAAAWNPVEARAQMAYGHFKDLTNDGIDYWRDASMRFSGGEGLPGFKGMREGGNQGVMAMFDDRIAAAQASNQGAMDAVSQMTDAYQAETAFRAENQPRQQQAYARMMGDGFTGGVINDTYQKPGFGQITGSQNPFGTPGQGSKNGGPAGAGNAMTGIDMSWANGVYGGGAGTFSPTPWGGRVPGKWNF